jgi:DNA (cytosine-5)-methyltransferase 1
MENVPDAPTPSVTHYGVTSRVVRDVWCGGETSRERVFSFGEHGGVNAAFHVETLALHRPDPERTVVATSSKEGALAKSQGELRKGVSARLSRQAAALPGQHPRRSFERCCELQGLPRGFLAEAPLTMEGKYRVVGNGVPLPMGRAVAKAVKRAVGIELSQVA